MRRPRPSEAAMLKIELEHPRTHGLAEKDLSRWRAGWPTWPVASQPEPFDRDAAIAVAATNRYPMWFFGLSVERIGEKRDGHMVPEEQAFWASLLTSQEFVTGDLPEGVRDPENREHPLPSWVAEHSGRVEVGIEAEAFLDLCAPLFEQTDPTSSAAREVYKCMGRAMRWYVPWAQAFEHAMTRLPLDGLYTFVEGMGPAPEAECERAKALAREVFAGVDFSTMSSFELTYGSIQLLLVAPIQDLIVRYFEAWKVLHEKPEPIQWVPANELVYMLTDIGTFTKVFKSLDFRVSEGDVDKMFARFGYACIDPLMSAGLKPRKDRPGFDALRRALTIAAPEMIAQLQPLASKGGRWGTCVRAHIDEAPAEHAAHGLIACCNRAGKKRTWAVEELRRLADRADGVQAIEAALTQWKKVTSDFVRAEVLDHEDEVFEELALGSAPDWVRELAEHALRVPAPNWWRDETPRLTLGRDELALPAECSWGLAAWATGSTELDSATFDGLNQGSAARLAEVALGWWYEAVSVNGTWPLRFAAAFPNEASVAALERFIRATKPPFRAIPRDDVRLIALRGLGRVDLPSARRSVQWLAGHHAKDAYREAARAARASYCEANAITLAEYGDRCVSSFGLDERSGRDFDYGPRTVRMKVSGRELSFVDLASEKITSRLPKGTRKDDTDKVKRATEAFKVVAKPLREELVRQLYRFEIGMLTGRRWKAPLWRQDVLGHPLLGALASGLVWAVWSKGRRVGLARPDEEGQLIDADFDAVSLRSTSTLSLPHPMDLSDEELAAWQEHLLGFEIAQPFDQIGRPVYTADAPTRALLEDLRSKHLELDLATLLRLSKSGLANLEWGLDSPRCGYAVAMHLTVLADEQEGASSSKLSIECAYNSAFSNGKCRRGVTSTPYIGMQYGASRTMPRGSEDPASALDLADVPARLLTEAIILLRQCAVAGKTP